MVTTSKLKYYQLNPASNHPYLNHATALLSPGHQLSVPALYNPSIFNANAVSPWPWDSKPAGQNGTNGLSTSAPTKTEHQNDTKSLLLHLIGVNSVPNGASANAQKKRFLICDQTGNQTRFFFSQGHLPENGIFPSKDLFGAYGLLSCDNMTGLVEQRSLMKPVDKLDGSDENAEESYMREDTEEIKALLYSSDGIEGEEDDSVYGEDDEVTSTGRSPCADQGGCGEHDQQSGELTEEVASSDGARKRQRLADGGYKRSSSVESKCANDGGDVESKCVKDSLPLKRKDKDSSLSTREKKANIRETLRILESLIPGIKNKNPLSVIDEAIDYLKSLRGKAKALGVVLPQDFPPASF